MVFTDQSKAMKILHFTYENLQNVYMQYGTGWLPSKKKSLLTRTGAPSNVTSPREPLQAQAGWQEIVKDKSPGGYSYDEEQNVLWLRLTMGGLVNITLK